MKKLFSKVLLCLLSTALIISPISAQASEISKTYTLSQIRKLALQNAEKLDTFKALRAKYEKELQQERSRLGDQYVDYDDNGKEIIRYAYDKKLSYDYPAKIEEFDKIIKQLKKQNELAAIRKYNAILNKQIELQKKENELALKGIDVSVAKKSFALGRLTLLNYQTVQADFDTTASQKKQLHIELETLYEDLNRLIGIKKDTRYLLDTDQLLTKATANRFELSVPTDAVSYIQKDSSLLKDMNKSLQEKKKQLEIFAKSHPIGSDAYTTLEKELDLYGIEKELKKEKNALYFDLENDYLEILLSLLNLSTLKQDMDFQAYQNSLDTLKYQNGFISKQDFTKKQNTYLEQKQDFLSKTLTLYEQILQYEIKTGTDTNTCLLYHPHPISMSDSFYFLCG